MSAEKLKALVEKGNLINLNIVSDQLGSLLNEIATMLVDQQKQITSLKKEIIEKVSKKDFDEFKDTYRSEKDRILRTFPNYDSSIARLNKDLDLMKDQVAHQIDTAVSSALMSVDTQITQKTDLFAAEQMLLSQSIASMENKLKATLGSTYAKASAGIIGAEDPELKKKLAKIESQMASIRTTAAPVDQSAIEDLRTEMKKEIEALQQRLDEAINGGEEEEADPNMQSHEYNAEANGIEPIAESEDQINEIDEIKQEIANIETALEDQNKSLISRIERKSEISLVERMFEKLRVIIAGLRDDISKLDQKVGSFVMRTEMENYVQSTLDSLLQEEQSAFTHKPIKCLACGKHRLKASAPQENMAQTHKVELPMLGQSPKK